MPIGLAIIRGLAKAVTRDPPPRGRSRAILEIAAADFLNRLSRKAGKSGRSGYAGWEVSNLAGPAFWAMLLLSQGRRRFGMSLLAQIHSDRAAVRSYVQEKQAAQEILAAIPGIDAESLTGFVDVAISQFQPSGVAGEPLVPPAAAQEILKAALLRGAIVGELRPEAVQAAWTTSHTAPGRTPEREWRRALEQAESLYATWKQKRGRQRPAI